MWGPCFWAWVSISMLNTPSQKPTSCPSSHCSFCSGPPAEELVFQVLSSIPAFSFPRQRSSSSAARLGASAWVPNYQAPDNHLQAGLYYRKSILNIHWKDWCWSWSSNTLATWWEELTHWKRPWCWERLRAGGEGGDRGWDGWMASPIQWTWTWANSGRWWGTGKPGVLQSMELERVGHDLVTERQQQPHRLILKSSLSQNHCT